MSGRALDQEVHAGVPRHSAQLLPADAQELPRRLQEAPPLRGEEVRQERRRPTGRGRLAGQSAVVPRPPRAGLRKLGANAEPEAGGDHVPGEVHLDAVPGTRRMVRFAEVDSVEEDDKPADHLSGAGRDGRHHVRARLVDGARVPGPRHAAVPLQHGRPRGRGGEDG